MNPTPREIELQRIADELNDTSAECLAALDELKIIQLERDLASVTAERDALRKALERIASDHVASPGMPAEHIHSVACDACHRQEIAKAALNPAQG